MRGTPTRRLLGAVLVLGLFAGAPAAAAAEIQPLMAGWERIFTIKWELSSRNNRPVVQGRIQNISPYSTRDVRVLVDALDGGGKVTAQRIAHVPGDLLGGSGAFFEVPMPAASGYRVRVHSYDRIESPSDRR